MNEQPLVMTKKQVAEFLQVSPYTVEYWVKTNQVPYSRVGKRGIRFFRRTVEDWLVRQQNIPFRVRRKTTRS